ERWCLRVAYGLLTICSEAVEQSRTAHGLQTFLTTAPACMRRIPRRVWPARVVRMADLRGAFAAAGPVVTCMVSPGRKRPAVGLRAREDIVPLVIVRRAGDDLSFFG